MTSRNPKLGRSFWFAVALLLMGCGIAQAQELEGTWRLVMRKLPDGTTQVPPAVLGAYTAYKELQNLNVFWHTPEGKPAFFSRISTYKLSNTEYTETLLAAAMDDVNSGGPTFIIFAQTAQHMAVQEEVR